MKATLEFDLDEDADREKHEAAMKAMDLKWIIQDFSEYLKKLVKYEDRETVNTEEIREQLWKFVEERNAKWLFS